MKRLLLLFISGLVLTARIQAVSIDAPFMKKALEENKFFIEFINVHVTNFRNDEYFSLYKSAAESDFEANLFNLAGNYVKAYQKVIESQKQLRILYYKILTERYEVDTAEMLRMSSPIIMLAKDKKAEFSLRNGYDNLNKAVVTRKYGFNTSKHMLSQKIKFYMDAIHHTLEAKRYAIFSLVESTIPLIDKSDYKTQTWDEAKKNIEKINISVFDYVRNELINNLNKGSLPSTFPFLLHLDDSYGRIFENKNSALNEIGTIINARVKKIEGNNSTGGTNQGTQKESLPTEPVPEDKAP